MDAVKKFNFHPDVRDAIVTAPADVFAAAAAEDPGAAPPETEAATRGLEIAATNGLANSDGAPPAPPRPRRDHPATCRSWLRQRAHALVLAPSLDPLSVVRATLPALFPSCPLVVYCDHLEPLTRLFAHLKDSGDAVHIQLTETWQRDFQILENRSHPKMTMTANAGYVLSAIKVVNDGAGDGAPSRKRPRDDAA